MRFKVELHRNKLGGGHWWKPFVLRFLRNTIRKSISTYWNSFRIVWLGLDLTVEWG